ncbi:hypothetical protein F4824DRAFT_114297 [Ustulina deusta]|nr:hypothetical protein F4823DRAFT_366632 [Ustulina deusta]KAI3342608.1 hypothetical protein F4824DRAFT_114297 [Ustulina deusta]
MVRPHLIASTYPHPSLSLFICIFVVVTYRQPSGHSEQVAPSVLQFEPQRASVSFFLSYSCFFPFCLVQLFAKTPHRLSGRCASVASRFLSTLVASHLTASA